MRSAVPPISVPFKWALAVGLAWWLGAPGAAPAAEAPVRHEALGVCTHFAQWWDADRVMPHVGELGVGWIRDGIYWDEIEPRKGEYQIPAKLQHWIDLAQANNLKVVGTFAHSNPLYANPYDPDAYAAAAAFVVTALKGKIHALEVLNEPNNTGAGYRKQYGGTWSGIEKDGSTSPWVSKYVELLNKTAAAVKAANPAVKVIGMGSTYSANFHKFKIGVSPQVDGITDHPYSARTVPEAGKGFEDKFAADGFTRDGPFAPALRYYKEGTFTALVGVYRELAAKFEGPSELWFTEWGYSTWVEGKGSNPANFAGFTEPAQAKYLQRRLMQCLGLNVTFNAIYDFMDDGTNRYEVEQNFGLVRKDLTRKPAFAAVQRLAAETADLKAKPGAIKVSIFPKDSRHSSPAERYPSPGTIQHYVFTDPAGSPVVALWSAERANDLTPRLADVEFGIDGTALVAEVTDLMTGDTYKPESKGDGKRLMLEFLEVPDHPILVRFRPKPAPKSS